MPEVFLASLYERIVLPQVREYITPTLHILAVPRQYRWIADEKAERRAKGRNYLGIALST